MKFFTQKTKYISQSGFTLIEVMVAVSIFAIIMTVGIGALLIINNTYRQSEVERQSVDSLTYVLETMSREIRTAQSWTTTANGSSFEFVDQDNLDITYQTYPFLNNAGTGIEMIVKAPLNNSNQNGTPAIPYGTYDLTPVNVTISDTSADGLVHAPGGGLTFTIEKGANGTGQSYVQINLGGIVTYGSRSATFSFQTGVSKRVLD